MKHTNIVFWLGVVATLAASWFLLSFAFKAIGGLFLDALDELKRDISEEEQSDENEEEN